MLDNRLGSDKLRTWNSNSITLQNRSETFPFLTYRLLACTIEPFACIGELTCYTVGRFLKSIGAHMWCSLRHFQARVRWSNGIRTVPVVHRSWTDKSQLIRRIREPFHSLLCDWHCQITRAIDHIPLLWRLFPFVLVGYKQRGCACKEESTSSSSG